MVKRDMGLFLKKAREAKGLSLREAGAEARIEFKSIHGYETGIEPGFSYAVILCDLYGVELEALAAVVMDNDGRRPTGRDYGRRGDKETMGSLFRDAREVSCLTTREAAAGSTVNNVAITRYENDRNEPGLRAAVVLCDFYGIDVQALADIVREKYRRKVGRGGRRKLQRQGKKTWYLCKDKERRS